jgi:4-oxalocrotonate tautomerase
MPFINVKLNSKQNSETREEIVKIVLDKTSNILNKNAEVTSILVEFCDKNNWSIGGKKATTFLVDIKITKGTNTKNEKQAYIKEIYQSFKNLLGNIDNASYIIIDEIEADSWGFEGITQEERYIKSKI